MGEKQNRRRKHLHLLLACIVTALVLLSGCARLYKEWIAKTDLERAEYFASEEDYDMAVNQYERAAASHPFIGDEILFRMGVIYVSPRNQRRDYRKALDCFNRLVSDYPESPYRRDSDAFVFLINEIFGRDKEAGERGKRIEKLERQVEETEKKLERIKEVDMHWKRRKSTEP